MSPLAQITHVTLLSNGLSSSKGSLSIPVYYTTERAQGCLDSRSSPILFRAFLKDCHQFSTTQLVYNKSVSTCLLFYVKPKNSAILQQFLHSCLHSRLRYNSYCKVQSSTEGVFIFSLVLNSVADPFIPDPTFFHPGSEFFHPVSWIRIKEFKYFNPKKWFLSSRKYDPGCSSRIPDRGPYFLPIPDPGSRGLKGTGPDPGSGSATLVINFLIF